jgi:hypothetical protein
LADLDAKHLQRVRRSTVAWIFRDVVWAGYQDRIGPLLPIPPPAYSANYSAQGAFGGKKVPKRAVKTARGGASTAYEKTPDPLEEPGVFVEKSRVRAEGLEPSTQGLKGV